MTRTLHFRQDIFNNYDDDLAYKVTGDIWYEVEDMTTEDLSAGSLGNIINCIEDQTKEDFRAA